MTVLPKILDAIQFATVAHAGQLRGGKGVPYVTHVLDVARRVSVAGFTDQDTIIAAILHDVVEDTDTTLAEIHGQFGGTVMTLVADLTLPLDARSDRVKKQAFQIQKMTDMGIEGRAIKIADKTSNVFDLVADPPSWSARAFLGYTMSAREVVYSITGGDTTATGLVGLDERLVALLDRFDLACREVVKAHGPK